MEQTLLERPPEPASKKIGKVETDMFCADCGYNMHGLDVLRDARLEIAVVRCPECGKFHPAGIVTGAGRVWLNRLASLLIGVWVLLLILGVIAFGFFSGCLDVAKIEGFLGFREQLMIDGRVTWGYAPLVETRPEAITMLQMANVMLDAGSLAWGLLAGMGMVTLAAHVKRRWAVALGIMPLLAVTVVSLAYYVDRQNYWSGMAAWFTWRLSMQVILQWCGLAVGVVLGRPLARGLLRLLIAPRLLQQVRFLWEVDGKVPPPPKSGATGSQRESPTA